MKALLQGFFAAAALLFAFTPNLSARRFLFLESTYVGDGWYRYTISAPDDPSLLFADVGVLSVYEPGMAETELGPPPPRWTNDPSSDPALTWVSEDINGWNVNRRPYSTSFQFRSGDTFKRGTATLIFSLALVTGWGDAGPVVSANIVGYWNAPALVPGSPVDGLGTNLLTSLPSDLPDPVMAELVRNGRDINGIAFVYPNPSTMRLEGTRDFKVWRNVAYIYGANGRTTWTSSSPLNDFGNFFRVNLVAEGHATGLPPLEPVSPRFLPAGVGAVLPAGPAPAGKDSGARLLSARPCIEGAVLTLAVTPGKHYFVTLLDDAMQPAWTVAAFASSSTIVVRLPTAPPDFGFVQITEDPR